MAKAITDMTLEEHRADQRTALGSSLEQLRLRFGYTCKDFARLLSCSEERLRKIEAGHTVENKK